jgi:hypothetical protein
MRHEFFALSIRVYNVHWWLDSLGGEIGFGQFY